MSKCLLRLSTSLFVGTGWEPWFPNSWGTHAIHKGKGKFHPFVLFASEALGDVAGVHAMGFLRILIFPYNWQRVALGSSREPTWDVQCPTVAARQLFCHQNPRKHRENSYTLTKGKALHFQKLDQAEPQAT